MYRTLITTTQALLSTHFKTTKNLFYHFHSVSVRGGEGGGGGRWGKPPTKFSKWGGLDRMLIFRGELRLVP